MALDSTNRALETGGNLATIAGDTTGLVGVASSVTAPLGTDSAIAYGIQGATGMVPVVVADGGGSLTIDGDVSIDDGGNTITVDGTVAVTGVSTLAEQQTQTTSLQLLDDTVYVDDADWTDNTSKHVLVGGVYQSTQHTVTDGDVSPLAVDENGNLRVNIVAGAAAGGTSQADDADFTDGTTAGTPAMGVYESTPSTVTDGDLGVVGITTNRQLKVTLFDTAGVELAVGGGTQYTEDAAAAANPVGNALMMVRDDALSGQTTTDGDNVAARGTDKGELYVKHVDTIAVTQSGTWDEIGINDSGNSITVDNATLAVVGGGTEATALRVTLANDSTGLVSVDDNGGSLTVDGTVTVTGVSTLAEQQTQTTALQLIDDVVYTDDTSTHATGTSKGVGIMAAAVPTDTSVSANDIGMVAMTTDRKLHVAVMDALPAGSAAIGKLAANSGVDIGDVDVVTCGTITPGTAATSLGKAEDGGHTSGDVGVMALGVRVDTPNVALTNTDADYGALALNKLGSVRVAALEDDLATAATKHTYKYYTNAGAVTDGIIWSPAAGARWFLSSLTINTSAAATVTIEDDVAAGDVVRFKFEFAANSGIHMSFPTPMFSGEDAADLLVTTSAGNIYITAVGWEI